MWSDILTGYGIFILEILTILLVIAAIVAMIISAKQRNATHHGAYAQALCGIALRLWKGKRKSYA